MWLLGSEDQAGITYLGLTLAMVVTIALIGTRWRQYEKYSVGVILLTFALLLTAILFPVFATTHGCR